MLIHRRLHVTYRADVLLRRHKISRVSKQAPSSLMRADCKEKCNPTHVNLTTGFIFKRRHAASLDDCMLHCFIAMQHLRSLHAISWRFCDGKRQLIQRTHFKSHCPNGEQREKREESKIPMSRGRGSSNNPGLAGGGLYADFLIYKPVLLHQISRSVYI